MRAAPFASCVALVAMLAVSAAPSQAELQKIKLTVAARTAATATYFIAIEKGYFAEQGLEVELVDAGGGVAVPALISGSVDFSMSAAVSVGAIMRGAALRIIYTMADRPPYQLWSTQADLKTLADLKGKQIGIISRGDTFELAMRMVLRDAGLPPDFVGFTALGPGTAPRQAALMSGSLPSVMLSSGDVLPLRDTPAFAKAHLIVDMAQAIRMPYTGIVTSARNVQSDPELVKRFLRATVRGAAYMRAFRDQTVDILMHFDPQGDRRAFAGDWDDFVPTLTADGMAPAELITKDLAIRAALLDVPADKIPPVDKIYDYSAIRAVNAEFAASGWKPTP